MYIIFVLQLRQSVYLEHPRHRICEKSALSSGAMERSLYIRVIVLIKMAPRSSITLKVRHDGESDEKPLVFRLFVVSVSNSMRPNCFIEVFSFFQFLVVIGDSILISERGLVILLTLHPYVHFSVSLIRIFLIYIIGFNIRSIIDKRIEAWC